jgi:peptidoglycan/xylan/chitin deacetylase (PgdA/CDA1 family)
MTILCYHSVDPDWDSPLAVHPQDFARQCEWLARRRRVIPLSDAVARLNGSGRLPQGLTALTFDDGFAGVHGYAQPMLTHWSLPATVFLVAQTLTPAGKAVDWVRRPPETPLKTLTLDQVREMQEAGVDFQSHSWAHLDLPELAFDSCVQDLRDSRELLEDLLGRRVPFLAYPRGRHNAAVRKAAAQAGYSHAFALPEHREQASAYAVPRVGIHRGNGLPTVRVKCSPVYLPVRSSPLVQRLRAAWR